MNDTVSILQIAQALGCHNVTAWRCLRQMCLRPRFVRHHQEHYHKEVIPLVADCLALRQKTARYSRVWKPIPRQGR